MRLIKIFPGQRFSRQFLLAAGLFCIGAGMLLVASASQTTLIVAERELGQYWRTTYDILVRPKGARAPIEEKYGLVEANHLSGSRGGITFEQYESIKAIPGVEIAAPIAMLGYLEGAAPTEEMRIPPRPGVYRFDEMTTLDDGARAYAVPGFPKRWYYSFDLNPGELTPDDFKSALEIENLYMVSPEDFPDFPEVVVNGFVVFQFLIAGIDPAQEAALMRLDRTIVKGRYLRGDETLKSPYRVEVTNPEAPDNPEPKVLEGAINLPILINSTNYVSVTDHTELKRVNLPPEVSTVENILARGGIDYLDSLPTETLSVTQADNRRLYPQMIEALLLNSQEWGLAGLGASSNPSSLAYQESATPFPYQGLALAIEEPRLGQDGWPQYRVSEAVEFNVFFFWDIKGVFNIEGLPKPADVSRVPLETYFPPIAILRYDEQGNPVNPPRELRPTLNPAGYIQPPPLLLTTLEAARALRGDASISAIRVRVALEGCPPEQPETCTLTDAAQRKIEAIAIEIAKQTGLDVDIMVGSSPTRVLVHVPGIGYVEEQWIQKGVNLVYKQGIQTGNWLLLGTLLIAGALFTLDMAWAEVVSRRRVIALQKALGWRSRTVFRQIVGQVMIIGAIATMAGILIALVLIRWLKWESVPLNLLITLPLIVMGLCGIGSLVPAWSASRVPPIAEIQRGGVRYRRRAAGTISGLWSYAWNELKRRTVRSILTGLGSALSAALLTLLLGVTLQQRGMLGGTLLGEFILVNVEGYHYAIVAIGLGLAFLSTFNGLLGSILERRREIGVLKAIGWRTASIARLFIAQGLLLGIVGGSFGALAGSLAFLYFYKSVSPDLALVILLGMSLPGLVGALAALYPARLAAKVPPAEALRYE